jgi:pilus assembly protein CpaB
MGSKRTLILIAAIAVGVVAAFALFQYVSDIEDRAYDRAQRVEVYRVAQDIPKELPGEAAIEQGYVERAEIPQEFRPTTAITDLEILRGKVALNQLSAGQVVVDGMFVDPRVAFLSFSQRIPEGRVAITTSVDQVRGVAGLLVPGDKVNLIIDDPTGAGKTFLYQNVEILAIGSATAPDVGDTQAPTNPGSGLITYSVPPEAALRIALNPDFYLVLVPPDNVPAPVPPINTENLIPGTLTPYPEDQL